MLSRFRIASRAAALGLTLASAALGDPSPAESLFLQARADMKAGRLEQACPRFQQSFELVAAPGTLLNWGICEALQGHPLEAFAKFQGFLSQVPADDPRVDLAKSQLAKVEGQLGWLELKVADNAPAGSELRLDGEVLASNRIGTWLPLLPGRHSAQLTHPTQGVLKSEDIVLEATQRRTATLAPPTRVSSVGASSTPTRSPPRAPAPTAAHRPQSVRLEPGHALRTASYASAGIVASALAASLVFGGLSLQAKNTVARHCDGNWCDSTGFQAAQAGSRYVTLANVALVIGGVAALTGGGLLWASLRDNVSLNATPHAASLAYHATF